MKQSYSILDFFIEQLILGELNNINNTFTRRRVFYSTIVNKIITKMTTVNHIKIFLC